MLVLRWSFCSGVRPLLFVCFRRGVSVAAAAAVVEVEVGAVVEVGVAVTVAVPASTSGGGPTPPAWGDAPEDGYRATSDPVLFVQPSQATTARTTWGHTEKVPGGKVVGQTGAASSMGAAAAPRTRWGSGQ